MDHADDWEDEQKLARGLLLLFFFFVFFFCLFCCFYIMMLQSQLVCLVRNDPASGTERWEGKERKSQWRRDGMKS